MPICQYSIRSESDTGPEVRFAIVGMKVFHVWECENGQANIVRQLLNATKGREVF